MGQSSPEGEPPDEAAPVESGAGYPVTDDDALAVTPQTDAGTTRALAKLLRASPFLDLHERAGNPTDHRFRGTVCFLLDLATRLVVVVLLLGVLAAIAWKTLAPLPDLWSMSFADRFAGPS